MNEHVWTHVRTHVSICNIVYIYIYLHTHAMYLYKCKKHMYQYLSVRV